jgi:hypothetical protein
MNLAAMPSEEPLQPMMDSLTVRPGRRSKRVRHSVFGIELSIS